MYLMFLTKVNKIFTSEQVLMIISKPSANPSGAPFPLDTLHNNSLSRRVGKRISNRSKGRGVGRR